MSVIYRTTRRYIPVNNTVQSHNCELCVKYCLHVGDVASVQNFEVIAYKYEFIVTDNFTLWIEAFQGE
jgi:Pyruvate/2-oxoacid:ferredoxin oxidoreductase delta subunit